MTAIEWTEQTWNPVAGCSIVSPGCTHCYAMRQAARIERMLPSLEHYKGLTKPSKAGPVWTGKVALAPEKTLLEPLRRRKPTMYFVNSMSDLFHEDVPDEWIDQIFATMALAPQHTFQVLTKRSARMREFVSRLGAAHVELMRCLDSRPATEAYPAAIDAFPAYAGSLGHPSQHGLWPLPNVWLGVSAERQQEADERIPDLLKTPAAVRFVSLEPLLGPIDLVRFVPSWDAVPLMPIDWVIVGGESGRNARPMHPDWARSLRDQCTAAGVAFFFKQWGGWSVVFDRDRDDPDWRRCPEAKTPIERYLNLAGGHGFHGERVVFMRNVGKKAAGRLLDGRTWDEMPRAHAPLEAA